MHISLEENTIQVLQLVCETALKMEDRTLRGIVIGVLSSVIAAVLIYLGSSIVDWATRTPHIDAQFTYLALEIPNQVSGKTGAGSWQNYFAARNKVLNCDASSTNRDIGERIKEDLCNISFLTQFDHFHVYQIRLKNNSTRILKNIRLKGPAILSAIASGGKSRFIKTESQEPVSIDLIEPGQEITITLFSIGPDGRRFPVNVMLTSFLLTVEGSKVDIRAPITSDNAPDEAFWQNVTDYRLIFYVLALLGALTLVGVMATANSKTRRLMLGKSDYDRMKGDLEFLERKLGLDKKTDEENTQNT